MKARRKRWLFAAAALALSLLLELLLFNWKSVASMGCSWEALPEPEISGSFQEDGQTVYTYSGLNRNIDWVHILAEVWNAEGLAETTELSIELSDEGSQSFYSAGSTSYIYGYDKGSYIPLNSYGMVHDLKIRVSAPAAKCSCRLTAAEINGSVPFRISKLRILCVFGVLLLLYALRPSSFLYDNRFWNRRVWLKALCLLLILLLNFSGIYFLGRSNRFLRNVSDNPRAVHHVQYARLARALTEGKTWIDAEDTEPGRKLLEEIDNPYDPSRRSAAFAGTGAFYPWDTAYYQGHYYVYFGVVPVLIAYVPYYLLTHQDLPNFYAACLSAWLTILAAFLFLRVLLRRHFPDTPFPVYLLLSLLLGNGAGVLLYAADPCFYMIPIYFAQAFVLLALGLWISAAERWERTQPGVADGIHPDTGCFAPIRASRAAGIGFRIALGAFFAALVAGCRPQFLVFSFLALPIFLPLIRKEKRRSVMIKRILLFALPYAAVAVPLMSYNALRFGSPFDFGANYNLTTNDMPHRGWRWARLPDGLYAYLFQTPNFQLRFPYFFPSDSTHIYMGKTISEPVYGGVFLFCPFLWLLLLLRKSRACLRKNGLWALTLLPLPLALLVAAADTEMAGILWRYTCDILPLLYLSAVLVFLSVLRQARAKSRSRLLRFLVFAALFALFSSLMISMTNSNLMSRAPELYFRLKDFVGVV